MSMMGGGPASATPGVRQALNAATPAAMSRMDQMMDKKANPADVHYQPSKDEQHRCAVCEYFDGQKTCMKVAGTIDPNAVCDLFEAEDGEDDEAQENATQTPQA